MSYSSTISHQLNNLHKELTCLLPENVSDPELDTPYLNRPNEEDDSTYALFNFTTQRFDIVHENVSSVLSLNKSELDPVYFKNCKQLSEIEVFFDKEEANVHSFFYGDGDQKFNYKLQYERLYRRSSGDPVRLLHQLLPIKCNDESRPFKIFGVFTDISHLRMDGDISFSLIRLQNSRGFSFLNDKEKSELSKRVLSKREIEILILLSQDLSSKQIADKLFISPLTVANHRKNMLMKTGSKSTIQLLMKSFHNGWI